MSLDTSSPPMSHSLLDDPLIEIRDADGQRSRVALPEVFARLSGRGADVASFEALQAHQKQAWYSFLVQTAAMALPRRGLREPPDDPDTWRALLVELADDEPAAWALVVEDLDRPAFFQSPVPETSLDEAGYDFDVRTPDELDLLVTSKNHDLKMSRIDRPRPDHWIYALVTLQTLEGFMGRGNYGIVRMNAGFANRQLVGVAPDLTWRSRFQRDLDVLLEQRPELVEQRYRDDGVPLVWTVPWDGAKSSTLSLHECDPYFVEICRRVRFRTTDDGDLECGTANTKSYRMAEAHDVNGVTGDPWTPVEVGRSQKALNISGGGFDYELLADLLREDDYDASPAMEMTDHEDEGGFLIAKTIVREQGGTDGWYRRLIPVPKEVSRFKRRNPSKWRTIVERAEARVELAGDVEDSVLAPALMTLLTAGRDGSGDWNDLVGGQEDWIQQQRDAFDDAVDDRFFEALWESVDLDEEEARLQWQRILFERAEERFEQAVESATLPSFRRYRNITQAQKVFYGSARRHLEAYFERNDSTDSDAPQPEVADERFI